MILISPWLRGAQSEVITDEAKVPPYTLPNLLTTNTGDVLRQAMAWNQQRRPEILQAYESLIFGSTPRELPPGYAMHVVEEDPQALGGRAHRKQIEIRTSDLPGAPILHLLLYTPTSRREPVATFLCLNFGGNWEIVQDPGVRLYPLWNPQVQHRTMPPADIPRGWNTEWDIETVLAHGYGCAAVAYGDIEPDLADGSGLAHGVRALYLAPGQSTPAPSAWGAIGAWAWGLSRCLDYLVRDAQVDPRRIIGYGQSRLGKTVLWAGAQDPRFAMIIASCSGEGGAALSHRDFGENIDNMTSTFLYQFCRNFQRYHGHRDQLPVDAHQLLALLAPRPVLLNTGSTDLWSDPTGEFLAAQAATPVYALFGKSGPEHDARPPVGLPLFRDLGFHEHAGGHVVLPSDWQIFLAFADLKLSSTTAP